MNQRQIQQQQQEIQEQQEWFEDQTNHVIINNYYIGDIYNIGNNIKINDRRDR